MYYPLSVFADSKQVTLIIKSSSQSTNQTTLTIQNDEIVNELLKAKLHGERINEVPISTRSLLIEQAGNIRILHADEKGDLYDIQEKKILKIDEQLHEQLNAYFHSLNEIHFGRSLDWSEVDLIIPLYSTFKVTDLDSGLQFKAQRRAGSGHADAQPVSRQDTNIMKQIYGGKWSWNRKAILITYDDQTIAASMHGMPHGGGALSNGFPGHFCIHFNNSVTHRTKSVDLSHQVMVHKAAGELIPFVKNQDPHGVIELFFIAINHHDHDLLQLIYNDDLNELDGILTSVEMLRITNNDQQPSITGEFLYEIPLEFKVKRFNQKEETLHYTFMLTRDGPTSEWKLAQIPLK